MRKQKIVPLSNWSATLGLYGTAYRRPIVLCHGVFDIVHPGHLEHFRQAKTKMPYQPLLIVAIVADAYVRKGPGRPVFDEQRRADFLAELEIVDGVIILDSLGAVPAIEKIRPEIYAKGEEYANPNHPWFWDYIEEVKAVKAYGGRAILTGEFTSSSTKLIEALHNDRA